MGKTYLKNIIGNSYFLTASNVVYRGLRNRFVVVVVVVVVVLCPTMLKNSFKLAIFRQYVSKCA